MYLHAHEPCDSIAPEAVVLDNMDVKLVVT
jgi:hypothetical protein